MRADEYVVEKLQIAERELAEVRAQNVIMLHDSVETEKRLKKVLSLFECRETTANNGYQIVVNDADGNYEGAIIYCWDKEHPTSDFLEWLKVLGLELPIEQPKEQNTEELEKDPELVAQALEKAKELQAEKETENAVEEK